MPWRFELYLRCAWRRVPWHDRNLHSTCPSWPHNGLLWVSLTEEIECAGCYCKLPMLGFIRSHHKHPTFSPFHLVLPYFQWPPWVSSLSFTRHQLWDYSSLSSISKVWASHLAAVLFAMAARQELLLKMVKALSHHAKYFGRVSRFLSNQQKQSKRT